MLKSSCDTQILLLVVGISCLLTPVRLTCIYCLVWLEYQLGKAVDFVFLLCNISWMMCCLALVLWAYLKLGRRNQIMTIGIELHSLVGALTQSVSNRIYSLCMEWDEYILSLRLYNKIGHGFTSRTKKKNIGTGFMIPHRMIQGCLSNKYMLHNLRRR